MFSFSRCHSNYACVVVSNDKNKLGGSSEKSRTLQTNTTNTTISILEPSGVNILSKIKFGNFIVGDDLYNQW